MSDDLTKMIEFIQSTDATVKSIREEMELLQTHYDEKFRHADEIRRSEILFLQNQFFADHKQYPDELIGLYKKKFTEQKEIYTKQLKDLEADILKRENQIEVVTKKRLSIQNQIQKENSNLNTDEEQLKGRALQLESEIENFNNSIKHLSSGVGFITNLFKSHSVASKKEDLEDKLKVIYRRVDQLREKWVEAEKGFAEEDTKCREEWSNLTSELSMLKEKRDHLVRDRESIIQKSAFSSVLFGLTGDEPWLVKKANVTKPAVKCTRCGEQNIDNYFFCKSCAQPFAVNRNDVMGSLVEAGELSDVYNSMKKGMMQCVSNIALMRGFEGGCTKFIDSLKEVRSSQNQYASLPELKVQLPDSSVAFSTKLKDLEKIVSDSKNFNHPLQFANGVSSFVEKYLTAEAIESYFVKMGDELNRATKEQWP